MRAEKRAGRENCATAVRARSACPRRCGRGADEWSDPIGAQVLAAAPCCASTFGASPRDESVATSVLTRRKTEVDFPPRAAAEAGRGANLCDSRDGASARRRHGGRRVRWCVASVVLVGDVGGESTRDSGAASSSAPAYAPGARTAPGVWCVRNSRACARSRRRAVLLGEFGPRLSRGASCCAASNGGRRAPKYRARRTQAFHHRDRRAAHLGRHPDLPARGAARRNARRARATELSALALRGRRRGRRQRASART